MSRILRSCFVICLLCLLPVTAAWAWGALGHALVAELAQRHLNPKARAGVAKLLAGEPNPTLSLIHI